MEEISVRECARRLGVRHRAVQKAVETGRVTAVTRGPDGRLKSVTWPTVREQWARNTDPSEAAKNGKVWVPNEYPASEGRAATVSPGGGAEVVAQSSNAGGAGDSAAGLDLVDAAAEKPDAGAEASAEGNGYHAHRARREEYDAELKRLELEQKRRRLVAADDVERAAFDEGRLLRDNLLRIPDRLATTLAAEVDPVKVHALLARELRSACDAIANGAIDAAAESGERPLVAA
jgi:hypothetical protein